MAEKTAPDGTVYTVTGLWDETAFGLISLWQNIVGGTKKFVTQVVETVTEPVSKGISNVGKGLTSWIPILLVVGALIVGVYFVFIKGKK